MSQYRDRPYGLPAVAALAAVLSLVAFAPDARGDWDDWDDDEIEFDEASVFLELNHTDGDLGIHALIDGEPWKDLEIEDLHERLILRVINRGRLRRQGLTELFFESAEPSFDELDPADFFRRFPEGTYEIEGTTLEGDELESEVELTHLLPAPPENVMIAGMAAAEDCDADPLPSVPAGDVVISWDAVDMSHPELGRMNEPIEVVLYQLVVEFEREDEEPNGEPSLLVYSVDLPPNVTQATVPVDFIALGAEFDERKFEILVREESGNQTAVESCFEVEGDDDVA